MAAPLVNNIKSFATTTPQTVSPVTLAAYDVPGAGADKVLVVCVHFEDEGATVNSVTFGGDSLTLAITDGGTYEHCDIWYFVNPTTQTADIDVNFTGAVRGHWVLGAFYLTGADQVSPINDSGSDISSAPAVSLSTTVADCLLVGAFGHGAEGKLFIPGAGFAIAYQHSSASSVGMTEYKDAGPAGAQLVDATVDGGGFQPVGVAVAIAPSGGGPAPTGLLSATEQAHTKKSVAL